MTARAQPQQHARRPSDVGVLFTVGAGVGLIGLAEGVWDTTSAGVTHRVPWVLAYAVATWCLPALACTVLGLILTAPLARTSFAPKRATVGGGLGLGALGALAYWLGDGGALAAAAVGVGCAVGGAWALARCPGGGLRCGCVGLSVLVFAWVACALILRPSETYGDAAEGTPVILIVADALRADALSAYGAEQPTPHIDSIGAQGWIVSDNMSTSSWTLPAMASLWTGREPALHGVRTSAGVLTDDIPVLTEQLKGQGYRTAAVISNPILDPSRGFARGFDVIRRDTHEAQASLFWVMRFNRWAQKQGWISGPNAKRKPILPLLGASGWYARRSGYVAADEVTDDALALIDDLGSAGFFLYVHYFDPHDPYLPHPVPIAWNEPECTPDNLDSLREDYAGEVAYLDQHIGRLLEGLEARGLRDQALILFTADHGEEFLDHGSWRHRASLYDELVRVPLLVSLPSTSRPVGFTPEDVSLVDVAPTILDILGMPPLKGARGRSLNTPPLSSDQAPQTPLVRFADRIEEQHWLASVRRGSQTWILTMPRAAAPSPSLARRWLERLDQNAVQRHSSDAWVIPAAFATQAMDEAGALRILPGDYERPILRTPSWQTPAEGLVCATATVAGSEGQLALLIEEQTPEGWRPVPGSRLAITHTDAASSEVRTPPVAVAAGTTVRLATMPIEPLAPTTHWEIADAQLSLDDPLLLFQVELYDVAVDPEQQHDIFPGPPGAWEETVRLLLNYLASGEGDTERTLDPEELDRLRAMGYLR